MTVAAPTMVAQRKSLTPADASQRAADWANRRQQKKVNPLDGFACSNYLICLRLNIPRAISTKPVDLSTAAGLDEYISSMTQQCTCRNKIRTVRLGKGKFYFGESDRVVFVRYVHVYGPKTIITYSLIAEY